MKIRGETRCQPQVKTSGETRSPTQVKTRGETRNPEQVKTRSEARRLKHVEDHGKKVGGNPKLQVPLARRVGAAGAATGRL